MEYKRASCCLSVPCLFPVLVPILPVPSLVSNVIDYLVFQHEGSYALIGIVKGLVILLLCVMLEFLSV